MAAGHRGAGQVAKQIAGAAFMGGIAGRKMSGDSIGGDFAFGCVDRFADGRFVKLCLGRAIGSMAASGGIAPAATIAAAAAALLSYARWASVAAAT